MQEPTDKDFLIAHIEQLQATNAAQAQTIKAAHIRTAEISTRYNDCQRRIEFLEAKVSKYKVILEALEQDDDGPPYAAGG